MIVNTSRGGLIDTAALIQGLKATRHLPKSSLAQQLNRRFAFAFNPASGAQKRGWHHCGSCNGCRRRRSSLLLQAGRRSLRALSADGQVLQASSEKVVKSLDAGM